MIDARERRNPVGDIPKRRPTEGSAEVKTLAMITMKPNNNQPKVNLIVKSPRRDKNPMITMSKTPPNRSAIAC
jgi:hypothetical protein